MNAPHVAPTAPPAPPRPAAARPAARPGPKPDDGGGLRILTYLRLHWLTILFCGSLLGAGGAFAAWEVLASKYESYALLQVLSAPPTVANPSRDQARTDFVTYTKTIAALVKSEFVLNAALRNLADVPTIKAQKDPIKFLEEELTVVWQDGSEVVRVVFKGHEPADAKRIVDAVVAAFMAEVAAKDVDQKQKLKLQVEKAREEIRGTLDKMTQREKAPGPVVPAGGPPKDAPGVPGALPRFAPGDAPPAGPAAPNPNLVPSILDAVVRQNPKILEARIVGLVGQAEQLPVSIDDINAQLAVLEKQMDAIRDAPVSKATLDAVEKDPDVQAQAAAVAYHRAEHQKRASTSASPGTNPRVLEYKQIADAHEAHLKQLKEEKTNTIERGPRTAAAQKVAAEMQRLFHLRRQQEQQLAAVRSQLTTAHRMFADLPPPEKGGVMTAGAQQKFYEAEASALESTDSIYRRLVQQYYSILMDLFSPERVKPIQNASTPTQRDTKKQLMGTVFAGLMGFGLIALGAVGFETVTRRVTGLAEVKASAAGCPVVGVVPCRPGDGADMTPRDRAAAGEGLDKLRAYVSQAWLSRGATTVAVTSPLGDEGKAFAALGLAASLAQSGYKTLLADFDLRDPKLHDLAGVPNGAGVCELLRAEADVRSAVQVLPTGLHLLTAGAWSDDARKAATGGRLEALLAKLKGPYDCVVIHGHALLTAAEAVEVARRCEVVLVCARYRETTAPMLKRAAERVAAMEMPYSGVVYVGATETEALC
jgi:Mrp family chromosome partitioning ATPase/capsular polysaccharide biosynthesis protein